MLRARFINRDGKTAAELELEEFDTMEQLEEYISNNQFGTIRGVMYPTWGLGAGGIFGGREEPREIDKPETIVLLRDITSVSRIRTIAENRALSEKEEEEG